MSAENIVTDFCIWPYEGEKRLPVGISMIRNKRFAKLLCYFGDGSQPEKDKLVFSHVYQDVGIFEGRIEIFEKEWDEKPKQEIPFKVTVKEPTKSELIGTVGVNDESAIAYEGQRIQFIMTHPTIHTSGSFDDIFWDFGDETSESSKKEPQINHIYNKADCYTVKVTAKMRKFDTDSGSMKTISESKSFQIMILPKIL